jgi:hypothetical protein
VIEVNPGDLKGPHPDNPFPRLREAPASHCAMVP